jgi:hypothetical protein
LGFAPVARLEVVRLLLALAADQYWEVHHMDVKSAFLNGELAKELFVKHPSGFCSSRQKIKFSGRRKHFMGFIRHPELRIRSWIPL